MKWDGWYGIPFRDRWKIMWGVLRSFGWLEWLAVALIVLPPVLNMAQDALGDALGISVVPNATVPRQFTLMGALDPMPTATHLPPGVPFDLLLFDVFLVCNGLLQWSGAVVLLLFLLRRVQMGAPRWRRGIVLLGPSAAMMLLIAALGVALGSHVAAMLILGFGGMAVGSVAFMSLWTDRLQEAAKQEAARRAAAASTD